MRPQLLKFLLLFFFVNLSAQIKYEKGYFIDNQNIRTECLIKNEDWIGMPNQIQYKLSEESTVEEKDFKNIITVQIYDTPHYYKKRVVNIDRNTDQKDFNPKPETIVLTVLVEGGASLYTADNLFFYQKEQGEIKQLVYKNYKIEEDNKSYFAEDKIFHKELYDNLKCEKNMLNIRKLSYGERNLVAFFQDYNKCQKLDYQYFTKNITKTKLNLKALTGVSFNANVTANIDFTLEENYKKTFSPEPSANPSIAFGLELEVLLPFNKNKWALFLSPTYQTYKTGSSRTYYDEFGTYVPHLIPSGGIFVDIYTTYDFRLNTEYSYSYIELPLGVRHYFYLNEKFKCFLDGSYGVIFNVKKPVEKIEFEQLGTSSINANEIISKKFEMMKLGVGLAFEEKYYVALNYLSKKLSNSSGNTFSLLVSYKLF